MKILINASSAHMGGSVTHLQHILEFLPEVLPGGQVIVYAPRSTIETLPAHDRIACRAYPYASTGGMRRLYFDQVEIPRLARQEEVDVLYSTTGFGTLWSPVPQLLLVCNRAYFDRRYEAMYADLGRSFARVRLRRWHSLLSIWAASAVIFPTEAMQDTVASHISLSNTPTHPLHYGFDREDFFGEVDASSGAILSDLQAEPEGPVLLNVSTYAVQKNLKTLVKSLPALVEAYPELTLVTTTSRSQTSDKAQYDALQRWAERHDVDDHWLELGYVPHEQLATVYQAADLFVFPSFTESFGHSLVEAMASGLPVVASATDVHREVCGEAATYFDTFNASECADTIQAVLQAPERRASMRAQSLQRAEEFSWEGYTARLATILREVVRNG